MSKLTEFLDRLIFGKDNVPQVSVETYLPPEPVTEKCPFALTPDELVELERMPDPGPPFEPEMRINDFASRQVQEQTPFVWETDKGDLIVPVDMATRHLFYTLRMLFNHSVPPAFRVGIFKRHGNVSKWPLDYRVQAGNAMKDELKKRTDVEPWMRDEMGDMEENAAFLSIGQVPYKDPVVGSSDRTRANIEAILDGLPPFEWINPDTMRAKQALGRVRRTLKNRVRYDDPIDKPILVRGYTRANGNKVKGYWR